MTHPRKFKPALCHPEKRYVSRGLCAVCYYRARGVDPAWRAMMARDARAYYARNAEACRAKKREALAERRRTDPEYREREKQRMREYRKRKAKKTP